MQNQKKAKLEECLKKKRKRRVPEVDATIAEAVQKSMKTEVGGLECSSIKKDWRPHKSF